MAQFAAACRAARDWSIACAPPSPPHQHPQQHPSLEPTEPPLESLLVWTRSLRMALIEAAGSHWYGTRFAYAVVAAPDATARLRDAVARARGNNQEIGIPVVGVAHDTLNDGALDGPNSNAAPATAAFIPIPTSASILTLAAAEHELLEWEAGQPKKDADLRTAWRALACRTVYIPSLTEALRRSSVAASERRRSVGTNNKEKRLEITQLDAAEAEADAPVVAAALGVLEDPATAVASNGHDVDALLNQLRELKNAATTRADVAARIAAAVAKRAAIKAPESPAVATGTAPAALWAAWANDIATLFGVADRPGFGPAGAAARAALIDRINAATDPVGLLLQGLLYDHGRLVPRDLGRAVRCYRTAATAGLAKAQLCLALCLALDEADVSAVAPAAAARDTTVAPPAKDAVQCARAAAAGGEPLASLVLGWWYEYGWDAADLAPSLSPAAVAYKAIPVPVQRIFWDRKMTYSHGGWDRLSRYMPPKAPDAPVVASASAAASTVAEPGRRGQLDLLAVPIVQLRVARLLGSLQKPLERVATDDTATALQYWEPLEIAMRGRRPLVSRQDFAWVPSETAETLQTAARTPVGLHMLGEFVENEATGPVAQRLERALAYYQAAAAAGNPFSYAACGRVLEALGATSTWRFEAAALYLAGCVAGDAGAWAPLAWVLDALLPRDDPTAVLCWPDGPLLPAPLRLPAVTAFLASGSVRLDRTLVTALALVAAARDDGLALVFLGDRLDRGGRTDTALDAYAEAAVKSGSARALRRMALVRLRSSTPDDVDAATGLLRRAVAAGDDVAWLYLAGLYATGDAVPRGPDGNSAPTPQQHGRALRMLQTGAALVSARLRDVLGDVNGGPHPVRPTDAALRAAVAMLQTGAQDVEAAPRLAAALAPLVARSHADADADDGAGGSRWPALPTELLQWILQRLAPEELVAVRGVCRSWRSHVLALEALDFSNVRHCQPAVADYTNFRNQDSRSRGTTVANATLVRRASAVLCACGALVTASDLVASQMPGYVSSNDRSAFQRALAGTPQRACAIYARKHGGLLPPVRWTTLARVRADAAAWANRIMQANLTGMAMIALLVRPAQPYWRSQYEWQPMGVALPADLPRPTSPDAWAALVAAVLGGQSSDAGPTVELQDGRHLAWRINDSAAAQAILTAASVSTFRWSDYAESVKAVQHQLRDPATALGTVIRSAFGPNVHEGFHQHMYGHHSWSNRPDAAEWTRWLAIEANNAAVLAAEAQSPGIVVLVQAPLPLLVAPCLAHHGHLALAVCELWTGGA